MDGKGYNEGEHMNRGLSSCGVLDCCACVVNGLGDHWFKCTMNMENY